MPPDINRNVPELRPERVFPRMPRMIEDPPAPPRPRPNQDRNGNRNRNRNRNQQAVANNNNDPGEGQPRIPFLFRFFIGPQIARYLHMRRAANQARQNSDNGAAPVSPIPALRGLGRSEPGPSEPGPSSRPGPSEPGPSSRPGTSGPGPSSSRRN